MLDLIFCCMNTLVKIRQTYVKLSAAAHSLKTYVRGLIEEGANLFKLRNIGASCCGTLFFFESTLFFFESWYFQ